MKENEKLNVNYGDMQDNIKKVLMKTDKVSELTEMEQVKQEEILVDIETSELPKKELSAEQSAKVKGESSITSRALTRSTINVTNYLPKSTEEKEVEKDNPFGYHYEDHETVELASGAFRYDNIDFTIPGVNGMDLVVKRTYRAMDAQEKSFTYESQKRSAQFFYLYPKGFPEECLEVGGPFINSADTNYHRADAVEEWGGTSIIAHGYKSYDSYYNYTTALRDNNQYLLSHKLGIGWQFGFPSVETLPDGFTKRGGIKYRDYLNLGNGSKYAIVDGKLEDHTLQDFTFQVTGGAIVLPDGTSQSYRYLVTFKNGTQFFLNDKNIVAMQDRFGNRICFKFHGTGIQIWDSLNRLTQLEQFNLNGASYNLRWILPTGQTMSYAITNNILTAVTDFAGQTTNYSYQTTPVSARLFFNYSGDNGQTTNMYLLNQIQHPTGAKTHYRWRLLREEVPEYIDHGCRYRDRMMLSGRNDSEVVQGNYVERNHATYGYTLSVRNLPKERNDKHREYTFEYKISEARVHDARRDVLTVHTFNNDHLLIKEEKFEGDNENRVSTRDLLYNRDKLCTKETATVYGSTTRTMIQEWSYDNKGNVLTAKEPLGFDKTMEYYPNNFSLVKSLKYHIDNEKSRLVEERSTLASSGKSIGIVEFFENGVLRSKTVVECATNGNPTVKQEYNGAGSALRATNYSYQSNIFENRITVDGLPQSHTEYDIFGKITKVIDPNGNTTSYQRDGIGRVLVKINPDNSRKEYSYVVDSATYDNTVYITSENGNRSYIEYTPMGKEQQVTDMTNGTILAVKHYDAANRLWVELGIDDELYVKTETIHLYDHLDRPISKTVEDYQYSRLAYSETYQYNNAVDSQSSKATKTVQGDSNSPSIVTVEYKDIMGRTLRSGTVLSGLERLTVFSYDPRGNKLTALSALHASKGMPYSSKWEYDYVGRVVKEFAPRASAGTAEIFAVFEYDALGNNTRKVDFKGSDIRFSYDALGRLTQQLTQLDNFVYAVTKYQYDAAGNVAEKRVQCNLSGTTEKWNRIAYTYNNRHNLVDIRTYLDDGTTNYEHVHNDYDVMGNLTANYVGVQNNNLSTAQVTRYTCNDYGKVIRITDSSGKTEQFIYDATNILRQKVNKSGVITTFAHDALDRITRETESKHNTTISTEYTLTGAVKATQNSILRIEYIYNEIGLVMSEKESNGVERNFTYDIGGNRASFGMAVSGSPLMSMGYSYDSMNRIQNVSKDGNVIVQYGYDANGNRVSMAYLGTNMTTAYTYNRANQIISLVNKTGNTVSGQFAYTYYLDGYQASKTVNGKTINYSYDRAGRLLQESHSGQTKAYVYDRFSNRIRMDVVGSDARIVNYSYNNRNQLMSSMEIQNGNTATSYTYDNCGNEISCKKSGKVASTCTKAYNGCNQLAMVMMNGIITNYQYRPDGLRQSKTTGSDTTLHLWNGQDIVAELSKTGELKGRFYRGIGLVASQKNNLPLEYFLFNAHGDVVQRTNTNGAAIKGYDYDAFGVENGEVLSDDNPFRYCGEYYDKETQTIYLRARHYNPTTGRFGAEDPIGDGINWYTYCGGNPISFIDPSGLVYKPSSEDYRKQVDSYLGSKAMKISEGNNQITLYARFSVTGNIKDNKIAKTELTYKQAALNGIVDSWNGEYKLENGGSKKVSVVLIEVTSDSDREHFNINIDSNLAKKNPYVAGISKGGVGKTWSPDNIGNIMMYDSNPAYNKGQKFGSSEFSKTVGHEFGHILGIGDKYKMENNKWIAWGKTPSIMNNHFKVNGAQSVDYAEMLEAQDKKKWQE